MFGILIDPKTKTVCEIQTNGKYEDIARILNCKNPTYFLYNPNYETENEKFWFDLDGLIQEDADERGYFCKEVDMFGRKSFAGRALILGCEDDDCDDDEQCNEENRTTRADFRHVENFTFWLAQPTEQMVKEKTYMQSRYKP